MWFIVWMAFLLLFLATPIGYGWGYRGMGPPYPRAYNRRRLQPEGPLYADSWGVFGDILWIFMLVAMSWLIIGLLV